MSENSLRFVLERCVAWNNAHGNWSNEMEDMARAALAATQEPQPARDGVRDAVLNEAAQAICWECKVGRVPEKRIGQTSDKPYWRHYKQGEHYTICPASDIYALSAAKEQADGQ